MELSLFHNSKILSSLHQYKSWECSQVPAKDFKPDEDTGMLMRRCMAWFTGTFCVSPWKPAAFNLAAACIDPFWTAWQQRKQSGCEVAGWALTEILNLDFFWAACNGMAWPFLGRKDIQLPMSSNLPFAGPFAWPNLWGRSTPGTEH